MKVLQYIEKNIIDSFNIMSFTEKSAVIFDIDNTLIDKYGRLIEEIANIYKVCSQINLKIILITSRPATEESISNTENQLYSLQLKSHILIYFMKPNRTDVGLYKFNARQDVFKRGYRVIYSFGDLDTDGLNCIFAGNFIKIPT